MSKPTFQEPVEGGRPRAVSHLSSEPAVELVSSDPGPKRSRFGSEPSPARRRRRIGRAAQLNLFDMPPPSHVHAAQTDFPPRRQVSRESSDEMDESHLRSRGAYLWDGFRLPRGCWKPAWGATAWYFHVIFLEKLEKRVQHVRPEATGAHLRPRRFLQGLGVWLRLTEAQLI